VSVRAVLAAGFVLLAVALVVTLGHSAPRSAGSNGVAQLEEVATVRGIDRRCQDGEVVPRDAAALRLLVGTYGRPAPGLRVSVRGPAGETVTKGFRPPGGREGTVDVPVARVKRTSGGNRVCITVFGEPRIVLYGSGGRLHLEWMRPGSGSWFSLLPTIAHRFGLAKANPFGSLLLPLAALILLAAWAAAARLVLREVGE
jgi:hypothetical protein